MIQVVVWKIINIKISIKRLRAPGLYLPM
jgi:hypothetical protein